MKLTKKMTLGISLASLFTAFGGTAAFAQATLGPDLQDKMETAAPAELLEVIVSFEGDDALDTAEISALSNLGLTGMFFQELPMAGILAPANLIDDIASIEGVRSIYLNTPVEFSNADGRALTGVDRLQADSNLRNSMGLPYTGKGIGILINDSGIDATHPDLSFGDKTVQNALGTTNLRAYSDLGPVSYVEDVYDTDIGSGHGTHVAATAGGTGAASGGEHAGVAQGADIIGYGSGGVVLVLDTLGGLDYALVNQARYNIRVVNNSWGQGGTTAPFDPDNPTSIATKKMADRGIINVFAAGNDGSGEGTIGGTMHKAPWVVTVGAGVKDGTLVDFSSRGVKGGGGTVEVDGVDYDWVDRPNVVGPGVDIVSALANTGTLVYLSLQDTDYGLSSGTSMAAPHVAGVVALMLEANPFLTWQEIIQILEDTATNMPGHEDWEVGAGYVNTYAAVTTAAGLRSDFGATQILNREFKANILESRIQGPDIDVDYAPVGDNPGVEFEVAAGLSTVLARADVGDNLVAVSLIDPNGNRYGSSISTPVLGESLAVSAPAMPGTWTVRLGGIGSISGVGVDPLGVTNGVALPGTVSVDIDFNRVDGSEGIDDTIGHPAGAFVERAVAERLLDARSTGFEPDALLTRSDMADYLTLGGAIRQFKATDGSTSFMDTAAGLETAAAEAVSARGGSLRDSRQVQDAVMLSESTSHFSPDATVSRSDMAYSLVQSLGLQSQAEAMNAAIGSDDITVEYNGEQVALADTADIPAELRGHVQLALDLQLMRASFSLSQGPFDITPTLSATFSPSTAVTRGQYAFNAVNLFDRLSQSAE